MKTQTKKILSAFAALTMTAGLMVPVVQADGAGEFTAYDNFANLDFENDGYDIWDPGSKITVITDGTGNKAPQSGHKAIFVDGNKSKTISIWGGTTNAPDGFLPADGDLVSGTFWMKMMTEKDGNWYPSSVGWRLPKVRLYMLQNETKVDLAVTKGLSGDGARNVAICAPYTWTELEIDSTGTAYDGVSPLTWEITTAGDTGSPFMIDNVKFGTTSRAPESSETESPATPTPVVTPEDTTVVFDRLQFEDPTAFKSDVSGTFEIKTDDPDHPAYKGHGALHTSSNFSIWGGGGAKIADAKPGSILSGTVAFKLDQDMNDAATSIANGGTWFLFPSVKINKVDSITKEKTTLAELKQSDFNISNYSDHTWIKVNIPSTNVTFSSDDILEYAVERPQGGAVIMVDSITFTVTAPAPVEPTVTFNNVQAQAVGSTIRFYAQLGSTGDVAVNGFGFKVLPEGVDEDKAEYGKYKSDTTITTAGGVDFSVDLTGVPKNEKDTKINATPFYLSGEDEEFGDVFQTTFNLAYEALLQAQQALELD